MPEHPSRSSSQVGERVTADDAVLDRAATAALRAPSVLNSQPWHWRIRSGVLELRPEPTRALRGVDPEGRVLLVSCGVALHHAGVALAQAGRSPQVVLLPDADDPDLLATLRPGTPRQPDDEAHQQYEALLHRRTDRRPFSATPPSTEQLAHLQAAAAPFGVEVHVVPPDEVVTLATAAAAATESELSDPRAVRDLMEWVGDDEPVSSRAVTGSVDGVPPATVTPAVLRPVPARPLALGELAALPPGPGEDAGTAYLVLWSQDDRRADHLRAGQALSAVLLAATEQGLASSPISEVVETAGARVVLRQLLAGLGHPQIAVRVGVPDAAGALPETPRRGHEDAISLDNPSGDPGR